MSAQSRFRTRAIPVAAAVCFAALAVVARQARRDSASTRNSRAALQTLNWGLPVATSVASAVRCDTVTLGSAFVHCAGARTADRNASPVLLSAVSGAGALPPAEARQLLALADLWYAPNDSAARMRAIRGFRESVALAPDAAPALTDLSAALLLAHTYSSSVAELLEALDVASRALKIDPASDAAAWNRAIAFTWLGLHDGAQTAWRDYAKLAGVAAPVMTPIADPHQLSPHDNAMDGRWTDASRQYLWGTLLPNWGEAVLARDAARVVATKAAVDSLAQRSKGRDSLDSPAAIAQLIQRTASSEQRRSLATGFIAMSEMRDALEHADHISAARALKQAAGARAFQAAFGRWIEFERANLLLRTGNTKPARLDFSLLLRSTATSSPATARRAAWGLAVTFLADGHAALAVDSLRALLARCIVAHEEECVVAVSATLAGAQSSIGDDDSGLTTAGHAVATSSVTPLTHRRWTALDYLRLQADRLGLQFANESLSEEEAAVAKRLGRVDLELLTSRVRAERLLATHDLVAAGAEVTNLVRVWTTRASPSMQDEFRWDVLWMRGELARQRRTPGSVALLDSAVRASESSPIIGRSYPIRLSRARARLAAGDSTTALAEFDSLLTELRARGRTGTSVLESVRLAEVSRDAANESARSLLARGFTVRALDALSGRRFGTTRELAPFDERFESIAVREIGDSLVLWHRDRDGVHVSVSPLSVGALRGVMRELDPATLARLYDAVVRPWTGASRIGAGLPLRVDARGVAAGIPWAALRDRTSGQYLIEQREVMLVDDALDPGRELHDTRPSGTRALLIDAAPMSGERSLPGAVREIEMLKQVWGKQARVVATARSGSHLERAMAQVDVVHFAGHAQIDDRNPERSALSITTSHGDSLISAQAIAHWQLPNTRLVVLSACDTRVSGGTPLGGLESLAGVLRSVGVQSVIGAGWPVDDRATAQMMQALHQQLRDGATPSSALRAAQVQMLRSPDHTRNAPRVWAAFQLTGS